jgi:hypothetical protein
MGLSPGRVALLQKHGGDDGRGGCHDEHQDDHDALLQPLREYPQ